MHNRYEDVESDLSALHRIRHPGRLHPQRFIDLATRCVAYQGAVRFGVEQETADESNVPAGLDQDRTVDAEFAGSDPILAQFVEVNRVEVGD